MTGAAMRERSVPFLVFADLAFFLFAILVMSYQYVQVAGSDGANPRTDSFLLNLPRLPFLKRSGQYEGKQPAHGVLELLVLKNGMYRISDTTLDPSMLAETLSLLSHERCRLLVDREANAEALVFALGLLDRKGMTGIHIDFIREPNGS